MADRKPNPDAPKDAEDEQLDDLRRFKVQTVPPGARQAWLETKSPTLPPEQLTDTVPPKHKKSETLPYGMTPAEPQAEPHAEPRAEPHAEPHAEPVPPPKKDSDPLPTVVLAESIRNPKLAQTQVIPRVRMEKKRTKQTRLVAGLLVAALLVVIALVALRAPNSPSPPPPPQPDPAAKAPDQPRAVIAPEPAPEPAPAPAEPKTEPAAPPSAKIKTPKRPVIAPAAPPPAPEKKTPEGDSIFDTPLAPPAK